MSTNVLPFNLHNKASPNLFALCGKINHRDLFGLDCNISFYLFLFHHFETPETWNLGFWLLSSFFFFSLGPYLSKVENMFMGWKKNPLPFLILYKAFPIFDQISHPFRFTGVQPFKTFIHNDLWNTKSFTNKT